VALKIRNPGKNRMPTIIYSSFSPHVASPKKSNKLGFFFNKYRKKQFVNPRPEEKFAISPEQKGVEEHVKNQMIKQEEAKSIMNKLEIKSNRKIISIKSFSLIPFDMSFNVIEVEESRIIFLFKQPFSYQSHSVDMLDISNVFIESAWFFAKMRIVSRTFIQNDITIDYLNKAKATKVQMVIEGLRTFAKAKIDTSIYEIDELLLKLETINQKR
jgi:hypothetical protein